MNRIMAKRLAGGKCRISGIFGLEIIRCAARALLLLAAMQIFAQRGRQTLFPVRRPAHYHAPILIPPPS